jgi:phosphatidylserine decarboxylase
MSALTYATAQLLRALPRERVTRVMGRLADHAWSPPLGRAVVALYSRLYDVSLDECDEERWDSFDSFFTRELREGARPVDRDVRAIVSPADGRIDSMGPIDDDSTFLVKGRPYRLGELVGDAEAKRYRGGQSAVIYLSPRDYHRVHAPVAGTIRRVHSMQGDYFPVNAVGVKHVNNLFAINRRVSICIDTPASAGLGRVTVVMVAAIVVGRITVTGIAARDVPYGEHVLDPPVAVDRGGEVGIFHLGSTAVVFVEKTAGLRWSVTDGPVRYGEPIARVTQLPSSAHAAGAGGAVGPVGQLPHTPRGGGPG